MFGFNRLVRRNHTYYIRATRGNKQKIKSVLHIDKSADEIAEIAEITDKNTRILGLNTKHLKVRQRRRENFLGKKESSHSRE